MIRPDWPGVDGVRVLATTRAGGVSQGGWASFNLGLHCGDDERAVAENQRRLGVLLPAPPRWLRQVHGITVVGPEQWRPGIEADAAWTDRAGQVLAILTADCLPILLASMDGRTVAAVHAGWRGLAGGILGETVAALPVVPSELRAWIGPGIGQAAYEVDDAVVAALQKAVPGAKSCFRASRAGHCLADLKGLASRALNQAGVTDVTDARLCTASDSERFYSHRRDHGRTGRQATLIWFDPDAAPG